MARRDYFDFHLALEASPRGGITTRVLRSLAGRAESPFTLREPEACPTGRSLRELAEARGRALFESLFTGEVAEKFRRSLGRLQDFERAAIAAGDPRLCCLRVRLAIDPYDEELAVAFERDWEQMFDAESHRFLTRNKQITLVRDLEVAPALPELPGSRPLRVLVVRAQPRGLDELNGEQEIQLIESAWEGQPGVKVERLPKDTLRALEERLESTEPVHVLHFIGHGKVDKGEREGVLCFERDDRSCHPVGGNQLIETLRSTSLRLIILAACDTARGPKGAPARSIAALLMKSGVPAVLAMRRKVGDASAVAFAASFHRHLASGLAVDAAVTRARLEIHDNDECFEEWSTPTLFMSSLDGRIFEFGDSTKEEEMKPKTLGIRSRLHPYGAIGDECEHVCDLTPFFAGRPIRDPGAWADEVIPHLDEFLRQHVRTRRPIILRLDAHLTIAYAAGWLIDTRGVDVTLRQALPGGFLNWRYDFDRPWTGPLWKVEEHNHTGSGGHEVAVAIGVTNDNLAPVESYVDRHLSDRVGRILAVTPDPKVGNDAIRDGNHAFALAQELKRLIDQRTEVEQEGPLHLLFAAPWSLAFYLGQLSRGFGEVQLYEWEFANRGTRSYSASLLLATEEGGRR